MAGFIIQLFMTVSLSVGDRQKISTKDFAQALLGDRRKK